MKLKLAAVFLAASTILPVHAQTAGGELLLELNAAQPSDKGCRFTYVVTNKLGSELTRAAFEMALFNDQGVVDRLTVLDFRDMSVGKTKVSRFELAGTDCTKVSRILINSATECQGQGIEPTACMRQLKTSSKTTIEFGL